MSSPIAFQDYGSDGMVPDHNRDAANTLSPYLSSGRSSHPPYRSEALTGAAGNPIPHGPSDGNRGPIDNNPQWTALNTITSQGVWDDVHLAVERQEVRLARQRLEVELGRLVVECTRVIRSLSHLQDDESRISDEQAQFGSGSFCRNGGADHFYNQQRRFAEFLCHCPTFDMSRIRAPPLSSECRAFQNLGSVYYADPSLSSPRFNRVWNAVASHVPH
ncbi:hypothetical protein D9611_012598 [Ephemerocybe angulata]|uniref:Uncharacterized protein n=1 Tax=Ephemerocybe angulata TaxID=980116 RepID=A0A8H5AVL7_9AGAR|nr:hypothetical protein D9611_012598 [Tulosesus angulatus]